MKRRIVMALLALGVVGGYGAGIASAVHHHHACGHACAGGHEHGDQRAPE
jgi:hypothetical protein